MAPMLLHGYGSYGISLAPKFFPHALLWAERGGIFGLANIRGGGALGEGWHRAGSRELKFQSFKDFEYALRFAVRERLTSVDRLAIEGVSAGGLLMGAMMTSVPHLFACASASAGFYDMVRLSRYGGDGPAHATEFGDATHAGEIGYVWAYSPYHQVLPGVRYPAMYADAMQNDPRAPWMHTAKFIAALQAASTSSRPILLRFHTQAGHGRGLTAAEQLQSHEDRFKFVWSQVGAPKSR